VVLDWRVRAALCGPAAEGLNWRPSQQLVQGPIVLAVKAEVGCWPCP